MQRDKGMGQHAGKLPNLILDLPDKRGCPAGRQIVSQQKSTAICECQHRTTSGGTRSRVGLVAGSRFVSVAQLPLGERKVPLHVTIELPPARALAMLIQPAC